MNVGIVAKSEEIMLTAGVEVCNLVARSGNCCIFPNGNFVPPDFVSNIFSEDEFFRNADFIIVLGGDGTLLKLAVKASEYDVPVLGINFGRIGLLTDMERSELSEILNVFNGNYTIDERMLIKAELVCNNEIKGEFRALNDIVISRGTNPKMLEISLYIDNELTTDIRADGVIISTPTGSTAYSLSAGGSVIDPAARLIAFTPICPHTLKSRPLIISEEREITLKHKECDGVSYLSCDGQSIVTLDRKCVVNISAAENSLKLIRIKNRNFYSVLREKL